MQAPEARDATLALRLEQLLASYERWMGKPLATSASLFDAPFVVVAHGTDVPPTFWYGNGRALEVFKLSFDALVGMPSYKSAEPEHRELREQLMAEVRERGFISNYRGIRVASDGTRFEISNAVVWNILDAHGTRVGQAAMFADVRWL